MHTYKQKVNIFKNCLNLEGIKLIRIKLKTKNNYKSEVNNHKEIGTITSVSYQR